MTEVISKNAPQGQPDQQEQEPTTSAAPNYPDPVLANLKNTESWCYRDDESVVLPRLHVMNAYHFDIYGVDAIWHNMYRGPNSNWELLRGQYDATIDQLVQLVAKHVADGLYGIISITATKHSLTVICGSEMMREDMPDDMFRDPVDMKAFPWRQSFS